MKLIKRITILLTTLVLTVATFLSGQAKLSAFNLYTAFADEIVDELSTSDVLEDLESTASFNPYIYSEDITDNSLEVITIAESVNGYIYVYVYQPSHEHKGLRASSINISTTTGADLKYKNYLLEYVNHSQVWYKYVVTKLEDNKEVPVKFTNPSSMVDRVYEISGIYRPFDEKLDEKLSEENGNIINEVVYEVGKQFKFTTDSTGKISMLVSDIETIKITSQYVGFVRYDGNHNFWGTTWNCDSHFVAFSTERLIDELLEADVYFCYNDCSWYEDSKVLRVEKNDGTEIHQKGVDEDEIRNYILTHDCMPYEGYAYLNGEQTGIYESGKWKYEWKRIQSVEQFINTEHIENTYDNGFISVNQSVSLTEEGKANIESQQWVLRFYESEYRTDPGWYGGSYNFTMVYNVSILRLRFQTDGIIYNLGVLDNKQTGSTKPVNKTTYEIEFEDSFKIIIALILGLALLIVAWPVVSPIIGFIFKALFSGVGYILKAFWWVLTLPFKPFKKRRRK